MTSALTEQNLTKALQNHSADDAVLLYDTYGANIRRVVFSVVKNQARADDLIEQVFFNIWNNCDGFMAQGNRLGIWVMGQTRQLAKATVAAHAPSDEIQTDGDLFTGGGPDVTVALT